MWNCNLSSEAVFTEQTPVWQGLLSYDHVEHHKYRKLTNMLFLASYDVIQLLWNFFTSIIYSTAALVLFHKVQWGQLWGYCHMLRPYKAVWGGNPSRCLLLLCCPPKPWNSETWSVKVRVHIPSRYNWQVNDNFLVFLHVNHLNLCMNIIKNNKSLLELSLPLTLTETVLVL